MTQLRLPVALQIVTKRLCAKSTSGKHLRTGSRNDRHRDSKGDVWWVSLDPTPGSEIKKTRPCIVLTHDTLNRLRQTVVVIPLSTAAKAYPPITVSVTCQGKSVVAVVDQIRAVAKHRLQSKIETLSSEELDKVSQAVSAVLELRS